MREREGGKEGEEGKERERGMGGWMDGGRERGREAVGRREWPD